ASFGSSRVSARRSPSPQPSHGEMRQAEADRNRLDVHGSLVLGYVRGKKKKNSKAQSDRKGSRAQRARKTAVRKDPVCVARPTLAVPRDLSPLARLIHALIEEKVRFQVAGMSAAILQGVPATTLDTDLWIGLPSRQYMRILNLCRRLGATVR